MNATGSQIGAVSIGSGYRSRDAEAAASGRSRLRAPALPAHGAVRLSRAQRPSPGDARCRTQRLGDHPSRRFELASPFRVTATVEDAAVVGVALDLEHEVVRSVRQIEPACPVAPHRGRPADRAAVARPEAGSGSPWPRDRSRADGAPGGRSSASSRSSCDPGPTTPTEAVEHPMEARVRAEALAPLQCRAAVRSERGGAVPARSKIVRSGVVIRTPSTLPTWPSGSVTLVCTTARRPGSEVESHDHSARGPADHGSPAVPTDAADRRLTAGSPPMSRTRPSLRASDGRVPRRCGAPSARARPTRRDRPVGRRHGSRTRGSGLRPRHHPELLERPGT